MKRFTEHFVRTAKPGRYTDGLCVGLRLLVKPNGTRSYTQRLQVRGRRIDRGLGSPSRGVTLEEAREACRANMKAARAGVLPAPIARATFAPTVAEAAAAVLGLQGELAPKTAAAWARAHGTIINAMGSRPVDAVTAPDVIALLSPLYLETFETAKKVRGRLSGIMQWSVAQGHRADDPTRDIDAALPKRKTAHQSHAFDAHGTIGGLLAQVQAGASRGAVAGALAMLAHTAARSGEVRGMCYSDIEGDVWHATVPKMKRKLRVPLSPAALAIIEAQPTREGLVFRARSGGELDDTSLPRAWRKAGATGKVHGLRSAFATWCQESGVDADVRGSGPRTRQEWGRGRLRAIGSDRPAPARHGELEPLPDQVNLPGCGARGRLRPPLFFALRGAP